MRSLIVLLSAFYVATSANATSCRVTSTESIYRSAETVFLGQVVEIKLLSDTLEFGERAKYQASIKPFRIFKGSDPGSTAFTYSLTYRGATIDDALKPDANVGAEPTVVFIDNDVEYRIGGLYFVFLRHGVEPQGGDCSDDVLPFWKGTLQTLENASK